MPSLRDGGVLGGGSGGCDGGECEREREEAEGGHGATLTGAAGACMAHRDEAGDAWLDRAALRATRATCEDPRRWSAATTRSSPPRAAARARRGAGGRARPSSAPSALADAGRLRDAIFMQQGITFDAAGPDADGPVARPAVPARPRPADHPRRRVDDDQARARAAHPRAEPLRRRRLPRRARSSTPGIVPWDADRLAAPRSPAPRTASARRAASTATSSGCDLVRDADGSWKVLEDNVRTPSRHLLRAREPRSR